MNWLSGSFTFALIWWVVLFAVLPWGNDPPERHTDGEMPGAPANPRLKRKFVITTMVTAIVWLAIFAVIESNLISFRDMVKDIPD